MFNISSRFEINLIASNPLDAADHAVFMVKNRIPVVVTTPSLFVNTLVERQKLNADYKIIVSVDFENSGKNYALDKIRDLPREILDADGWDILLTDSSSEIESNNEMMNLSKFLRQNNQLSEIRWVISRSWSEDATSSVLKNMGKSPASFIRTDPNVKVHEVTIEQHKKDIATIKNSLSTRIKISGNVDWAVVKEFLEENMRFDVTVKQAKDILNSAREFYEQEAQPKAVASTESE